MKKTRRSVASVIPPEPAPSPRFSGQTLFLWGSVVVSAIALIGLAVVFFGGRLLAADSDHRLENIPFDGARAYGYLKQICDVGPRPSGSPGIAAVQKMLADHFEKLGAKVEFQRFSVPYPLDGPDKTMHGKTLPMANVIARFNPENRDRIMLCCHYDSLPFPLRDPVDRRGRFVGANDSGSGMAVLMEMGNALAQRPVKVGVDLVFFDGEEFVFAETGKYFWGSEHFANDYVQYPPAFRYRCAVLLDMVGGAELQLPQELLSASWPDSRHLVEQIWATAARLKVREFIPRPTLEEVRDDHLALHDVAKIPACDIIDFSYKHWHTQADTPENCSPLSLAKVGWVVEEWLRG